MKANELMIGDWVYLPSIMSDDKYPVQVLEIQDDCIKYYCADKKMMVGFKYVEPIPLTPEILKKNGLVLGKIKDGHIARCVKAIISVIELLYVHQLQNALRLCGIEKEIIL